MTEEQQKFYLVLSGYIYRHGFAPTITELQELMGYRTKSAAAYHVRVLKKLGLIAISPKKHRGMKITSKGKRIYQQISPKK